MNIPQAIGYAKIACRPVITGLYTLLLLILARLLKLGFIADFSS